MAYITIPDEAYEILRSVAAARHETLEALLVTLAQELADNRVIAPPMSSAEFDAVLGIKPEDLPELDQEAEKLLASLQ